MTEVLAENVLNKDAHIISVSLFDTQPQTAANYSTFYIAHRAVEVLMASESHGVAAGGAATLQIEKLTSGTAKGAGSNILTVAFDLQSTANTPVRKTGMDLTTYSVLQVGDRLALKSSGVIAAVKDLTVTIAVKPLGKGDYRL